MALETSKYAAHFGNRGAATLPQPEKGRGTGCETVKTF